MCIPSLAYRYEGDFDKNGERSGVGTVLYTHTGDRYEGEWKKGKLDGHGTYYQSNGDRFEGRWKKGQRYIHATTTIICSHKIRTADIVRKLLSVALFFLRLFSGLHFLSNCTSIHFIYFCRVLSLYLEILDTDIRTRIHVATTTTISIINYILGVGTVDIIINPGRGTKANLTKITRNTERADSITRTEVVTREHGSTEKGKVGKYKCTCMCVYVHTARGKPRHWNKPLTNSVWVL